MEKGVHLPITALHQIHFFSAHTIALQVPFFFSNSASSSGSLEVKAGGKAGRGDNVFLFHSHFLSTPEAKTATACFAFQFCTQAQPLSWLSQNKMLLLCFPSTHPIIIYPGGHGSKWWSGSYSINKDNHIHCRNSIKNCPFFSLKEASLDLTEDVDS